MFHGIQFPYFNSQQLNLDWIVDKIKGMLDFLPDDGTAGQILRRTADGAEWSDEQQVSGGAVDSVNGKTGDVVLDAGDILMDDNSSVEDAVDDLKSAFDDLAVETIGKNLVNPLLLIPGGIEDGTGKISVDGSYASYITSDFIPIADNTSYVFSTFLKSDTNRVTNDRKMYLLYDADKTPIASSYYNRASLYEVLIENTSAKYIRLSSYNGCNLMLEQGTSRTAYEEYRVFFTLADSVPLTDTMLEEISNMGVSDNLNGKKWIVCGDSFSDYTNKKFTSGRFSGKDASYPRLIAERTGMVLNEDFMLSGRTIAYPTDGTFTNSITCPTADCYYQNIPQDADYITIMLGINDSQHTGSGSTGDGEDATGAISLGTIDDTATGTYYGAYNTVLQWLRENRPFAHVGIIVSNGIEQQTWIEAQIAVAKKWGYPIINLNGDDKTPAFLRCYNPDIPTSLKNTLKATQGINPPSNTHPNWQTHELESTIIEAWLRSL